MKKRVNVRCVICGDLMPGSAPHRKYCDDCKKYIKTQWEVERKAIKRREKVQQREETGILAVVRKADALGLSYGQYVARYEPREER